jgi:outer membrane protein assembly factor BamB
MRVAWAVDLPGLSPAWPDQKRLRDDATYCPIVVGGRVIVASQLEDCVTAYDLADGRLAWRFFTGGPVRVAPAADEKGRVFVGSDDGWLYALDSAAGGKLLWKMKAAPQSRLIIGNGRMIDTWAVRGGPVVADGKVYFAGGIWPFMGVFVHCVEAQTGRVVWTNSGDGAAFLTQPHGDPSFAGIAPCGSLAVAGDKLLIPNGRSVPAVYELKTGKMVKFDLANKFGGDRVAAAGKYYTAGDMIFRLSDGKPSMYAPAGAAIVGERAYAATADGVASFNLDSLSAADGVAKVLNVSTVRTMTAPVCPGGTAIVRAGGRLYVGGNGFVAAVDLPLNPESPDEAWRMPVEGDVVDLIAADGHLLAVTAGGRICCFAAAARQSAAAAESAGATGASGADGAVLARSVHRAAENIRGGAPVVGDDRRSAPAGMVEMPPAHDWVAELPDGTGGGYALAIGKGTQSQVRTLVGRTALHVIVLEADPVAAAELRERLVKEGLYGRRVSVIVGELGETKLPPYFASVVIATDAGALGKAPTEAVGAIFRTLHPYRGAAVFQGADEAVARAAEEFAARVPQQASFTLAGGELVKLLRVNGPPGAGNWTNENADPQNTRVSKDSLVKAPLGILWFGGTSNEGTLPRHGHGPGPQVCDGRVILETVHSVRATDLYSGRLLWEAPLPGVGSFFDNTSHQAGANGSGSNFVSTSDGVYVAMQRTCVWLDPVTGAKRAEFPLPLALKLPADSLWGYLNVEGDYLIGGAASPAKAVAVKAKTQDHIDPFEDAVLHKAPKTPVTNARAASSHTLFVMDRRTGRLLWSVRAAKEFRHNAVCAGSGRLFAIDAEAAQSPLERIAKALAGPAKGGGTIRAFDLDTGLVRWKTGERVFGTYLSYSPEHDVLMESGRRSRDTLKDEPAGMRAYRASSGAVLWYDARALGQAMIRGRTVMKENSAADLLTGTPIVRADPITGAVSEWTWTRLYGCNTPIVSQNLITFRSGAAGFYDLARCGGTGNFGGFRSGCTNNLIVAGGVLVAPDYTRTCTCSYQMQTSLAMVSDEAAEEWTYAGVTPEVKQVRRLGINLGAPGDRTDDAGTPWLEYPSVGGKSPVVKVSVGDDRAQFYRRHASLVSGKMNWVTASGVKNARTVTVTLSNSGAEARPYKVRLYFAQPADVPNSPVSVSIQDQVVEDVLDVATEAGGMDRTLVKEYTAVEVSDELKIDLKPLQKNGTTILCGIEIIAEE